MGTILIIGGIATIVAGIAGGIATIAGGANMNKQSKGKKK
jgi:hypothetical protein